MEGPRPVPLRAPFVEKNGSTARERVIETGRYLKSRVFTLI